VYFIVAGAGEVGFHLAQALLEAGNEDPDGFRVTSHHVVATARRG